MITLVFAVEFCVNLLRTGELCGVTKGGAIAL